jgi:oligopeptide/dipeptide ABC transporter ATP-binding protein
VLYRGSVMEAGNVEKVIREPQHPYTRLLVNSIPWPDPKLLWGELAEVVHGKEISGNIGCKFANRCPHMMPRCLEAPAPLYRTSEDQVASCYLYRGCPEVDRKNLADLFPSHMVEQPKSPAVSTA